MILDCVINYYTDIFNMYVSAISNDLGSTTWGSGFTGPFSTTTEYIVGGFYAPGDGGGGIFVWIPTAITTPDGGITINNANDTAGHFKRIYSGPLNVRWFGAKGDGVTDDTAAVHAARDAAKSGTIYFPESLDADGNELPYVGAFVFDKRTSICSALPHHQLSS